MTTGVYTVKVVEQNGTDVLGHNLADAVVDSLQWTLNEMGTARVSFPKSSPDLADVLLLDREMQIYRDGTLIWWGPMILGEAGAEDAMVQVDVPDASWYFHRRQISDQRANKVSNAGFEIGSLSGWTASGVTATADTSRYVLGTKALKLVQASANVDTYEYQQVVAAGGSIGLLLTLAAWVYVQDSGWVGPAYESRGLFVSGIESSVVKDYRFAEIDDATPRDRWVRLETTIWVPPNKTWTLEVRLYAPGGTCWWDAVQLVAMESLSHYATDMGTIAGSIVDFIQSTTHGWSDLGIATSNATTGQVLDRHYQYADHTDAAEALDELEGMGLDWSIELTSTAKTFTTYWPRKGTDRSGSVTFSLGSGGSGNLSDYKLTEDGQATATRITILGEGDGPDREEGYAVDASPLGGLVLGDVVNARPNSPIDSLQRQAEERLGASKSLVRILEVVGVPSDATQIGTCVVGDTVNVSISDGWAAISGSWRIVQKSLDEESDTPSFVLNELAVAS